MAKLTPLRLKAQIFLPGLDLERDPLHDSEPIALQTHHLSGVIRHEADLL
jgi:hypothetical protein